MEESQNKLVSEFINVTGLEIEQARMHLERADWDLQGAISRYYDDHDQPEDDSTPRPEHYSGSDSDDEASSPPLVSSKPQPGKMRTMADLRSDSSHDSEDAREAFYAGGSEHSGQQILAPDDPRRDIVGEMMRAGREHAENPEDRSTRSKSSMFSGTGYRLGQGNDDSSPVLSHGGASSSTSDDKEVVLKLWRDGFSVNDGVFRAYTDPANEQFLGDIREGRIPQELVEAAKGGTVRCRMEDHRHEKYPVKSKVKPFSGKGHILGSCSPKTNLELKEDPPAAPAAAVTEPQSQDVVADTSKPTTSVQVRLADGTRMQATLNEDHTVADLRRFITNARPEYRNVRFTLLSSFPSKELDESLTLKDAGVLNSAILQRLK